jgi:hypothetical protein
MQFPLQAHQLPIHPNSRYARSWRVEISNGEAAWTVVHDLTDNHELNGKVCSVTYAVAEGTKSRFASLRQIGKKYSNHDELSLAGFEPDRVVRTP